MDILEHQKAEYDNFIIPHKPFEGMHADEVVRRCIFGVSTSDDISDDIFYRIAQRHLDLMERLARAERIIEDEKNKTRVALQHIDAISALLK